MVRMPRVNHAFAQRPLRLAIDPAIAITAALTATDLILQGR
jgi:hypothetical protein